MFDLIACLDSFVSQTGKLLSHFSFNNFHDIFNHSLCSLWAMERCMSSNKFSFVNASCDITYTFTSHYNQK